MMPATQSCEIQIGKIYIINSLLRWCNKESAWQCKTQETRIRSLGWEGPLEEEMATFSSILAWEIPWTEEPDGLQSMGVTKSQA